MTKSVCAACNAAGRATDHNFDKRWRRIGIKPDPGQKREARRAVRAAEKRLMLRELKEVEGCI